jgi:TorA maturation chaperone TorD
MENSRTQKNSAITVNKELSTSENVTIAKTQVQIYGFLASVFNYRPDIDFVKTLRGSSTYFVNDLAKRVDLPGEVTLGMREMADFAKAAEGKPDAQVEQELAVEWTRLFRGLSPQFSPIPPYEGAYIVSGISDNEILLSVTQFYRESGFAVGEEYQDRLDFIGMEINFLGHMAEVEAQAWESGNFEQAQFYQDKSLEFLDEHLGLWAEKFLSIAIERANTGFYKGFLHFCIGVIPKSTATNPSKRGGENDI